MARVTIPGYTIERELGSGGMAKVYLAIQHSLERKVALKVMSPILAADESFSKRFLREARTIAGLTHPNIVAIYEVGVTVDNLHFFAMQHLPGGDFASRMREGVSEAELRRVLGGIGRALGFAHERGFVHRDVTPANILFDPTGNPVLTDFGIARAVGGSTRITHTGVSIGTSIYMSPEQARGAEVDARSDLYSLGVLAYEALTGDVPYKGADSFAVAYAHVFEPIPRLPTERGNWQGLIDKALAKDPRDRYGSAEEFCAALSVMGAGGESATTQKMATLPGSSSKELVRPAAVTQLVEAVGKRMKRSQGQGFGPKLALGALALVAVLALGYGVYSQWAQPDDSAPV
ncbi:MAG: serine/threonine protein kinase, partial [Xanthomonadales bacterium]|nr:serine/threonine protein kinase [Xanthomonadales bacterium]